MRPPIPYLLHSTRNRRGWQEVFLAGLLLSVLTVVFFWPQLVRGRVLYWGDIGLYFLPMTTFLHANLLIGHLPLWNPLILCGTPFVGNPQTWPVYPISWLLPFVSAGYFLNLTVATHVWLASLGAFLFLRRAEGLGARASLVGAIVFGFGGELVSKEQFPNMVQAIAWLPWVLWAVWGLFVSSGRGESEGIKRPPKFGELRVPPRPVARSARSARANSGEPEKNKRGYRPTLFLSFMYPRTGAGGLLIPSMGGAVCLGLFVGLQMLAAHAQMTLLTLYAGAAYGVYLWIAASERPRLGLLAGRVGVAGAVAAGLCAVQVLPTLELYLSAARQKLPFAAVDRFTLPLNQLGNFALPTLHGSPFWGNFTGHGNFWETCCYLSLLGFVLAVAGIVAAWRGPDYGSFCFWSVVAGVGVWMALGGKGGLYHVAYGVLPGFRSFHDPARCLLWSAWGGSVLAAFGFEWVQQRVVRQHLRWVVFAACAGLIFGDLTHFGRSLYPLVAPAQFAGPSLFPASEQAVFDAHQGRVLAPDTVRVWQRFTTYHTFGRDVPDYLADWLETRTPNLSMLSGVPSAFGYEPEARRDAQTVAGRATDALRPGATWANRKQAMRWAGRLGVRDVVFFRAHPAPETVPHALLVASLPPFPFSGNAVDSTRVQICRNGLWQPRARLTTDFVAVRSRSAGFALLSQAVSTVVVGQPGFASHAPGTVALAPIVLDTPDRVVVQADNQSSALLVLADTLHPGWHAFVDNQEVPILSADGFLRAVSLPAPGMHRVVFEYRPVSFLLGCYLSLLTVSGLLAFGACLFCRRHSFFRDTAGDFTQGRE